MENKKETFGELITKRLRELNMRRSDLARRTGLSHTYIANLANDLSPTSKSGRPRRLPEETVDSIATALGLPVMIARAAAGLAIPDAPPITEREKLLALISELSPTRRRDLIAIADTMRQRDLIEGEEIDPLACGDG
jgi:transcriptional regulator with XRE-family HTH domain